ncbi:response regulator [Candidatus Albibeggiatoa sp. nov. NOAA]|uniref:response regulator n=1 Tax=Candidatus Albibeggiatoa sp. nov. NOAA TaxID=3162724 RepID=UPI0032FEA502|nr:response regulator [Thiotrichaceae bacterium]
MIRLNLKTKLSLVFLVLTVLPFSFLGYYTYQSNVEALTNNILEKDHDNVASLTTKFNDIVNNVPSDLVLFEDFYALKRYLTWYYLGEPYKTKSWWRDMRNAFASLIGAKNIYHSLQIIDLRGKELFKIKTNLFTQAQDIVPPHELKSVKTANYFTQTLNLNKGQISFERGYMFQANSEVLLLRYSMPIVNKNDEKQGIISITLNANIILDLLHQQENMKQAGVYSEYMLLDSLGRFIYYTSHGDYKNNFLEQYNADLAVAVRDHKQGALLESSVISTFGQIKLLKANQDYWTLVKQTDANAALKEVELFKYIFLVSIVLVIVTVLWVAHRFTNNILTPIIDLKQHLKALAQGQVLNTELKQHGHDEISELTISARLLSKSFKNTIQQANAIAQGNYEKDIVLLSDQDQLGAALQNMTEMLRTVSTKNTVQDWLKTGQAELNNSMSGEQNINDLAKNIISFLTQYLKAQVGVFYLSVERVTDASNPVLRLIASYGYTHRKNFSNEYKIGEGLVGQAALEKQTIIMEQVPDDYMQVQSGLGHAKPHNIIVLPFIYEDKVRGIIEIGSFHEFTDIQLEWLTQTMPIIAIAVNTAESRTKMQDLLQQSQTQAEELQSQSEELQSQQEELRQTNEELEQRTQDLERQKTEIHKKNEVLQKTQSEIEAKAEELELASKYKSEFLANMSHELRTPLNSMLILAQLLTENKARNLNDKQIEYAKTIHDSGSDLLNLINDILDLSKVEAGKIEVNVEQVILSEFALNLESKFHHVAEKKGLQFHINLDPQLPQVIYTDVQRFRQIITNLLSNAFKFTEHGSVEVEIYRPTDNEFLRVNKLSTQNIIAVSVVDSGIGIPAEKQKPIFEAFQQADGSTSRRFGGTGLGLSISRQLARLLGGDIQLTSEMHQGSTFTLYLSEKLEQATSAASPAVMPEVSIPSQHIPPAPQPIQQAPVKPELPEPTPSLTVTQLTIQDDRDKLHEKDRLILIIEDDRNFSNILMELSREKDFKCLVAEDGRTGLELAKQYKPHAIILDVGLPNVDGFTVMEKLKTDIETRHIPVHFVSGSEHGKDARRMGAIGYLLKPVSMGELGDAFRKIEHFIEKDIRTIMIVVDQKDHGIRILDIVGGESVESLIANQVDESIGILEQSECDCIVLDIDVEHATGLRLLDDLAKDESLRKIPIILYAERELTEQEEKQLTKFEDDLTVKAVRSPERLLDETTLFLHQIEDKLPEEKRQMLQMVHDKEAVLKDKKVLIVDDDTRNTFALATVLEDKDMEVSVAMNGKEALQILDEEGGINIVLMDIMMPEMDGYEAMQHIRSQPRFRKLPIIALTAKAMKGDKAKCIDAGASDYLSKPVDTDKLMSLMRVWLYR